MQFSTHSVYEPFCKRPHHLTIEMAVLNVIFLFSVYCTFLALVLPKPERACDQHAAYREAGTHQSMFRQSHGWNREKSPTKK